MSHWDREEERIHHHRPLTTSAGGVSQSSSLGSASPAVDSARFRRTGMDCDNCQAPEGIACQPWCRGEQIS